MKRRLITSALPYVNNVPHLGNLIQVLSADVFARFCRLRNYETLYICGTDEYGTATETRAAAEGISPRELCDRYYKIHADIYRWFNIGFDKFGRTSTAIQTEITQGLYKKLEENGYIMERSVEQLYCGSCGRFLADRYVRGICPHCGYAEARGDQCESCGKLLEPTDLKESRCASCGAPPSLEQTRHLYIDLPKIKDKLEGWIKEASVRGEWAHNAIQMTAAWIRDGLHERAITRDLKWGIPVPRAGYENKVFYVWFDAPIGYISITGNLAADRGKDWRAFMDYWWKTPEETELFQFVGKDNIPFHTVIFPSTLLGSGENWTMLHHMSSTEYLNYEGGKFSKSKGMGVFGTDVMETGIPADVWRFYIFYNRPEKSDATFSWKDFQEKVNGELIGNLGNLVNRTLAFVVRYYDGLVPEIAGDETQGDPRAFWEELRRYEGKITAKLEWAELRDAFRLIFELSSFANKTFQDAEPWRLRREDPPRAAGLIRNLCFVVRDLAILIEPFLPRTARRIAAFLGLELGTAAETGAEGTDPEADGSQTNRAERGTNGAEKRITWDTLGKDRAFPGPVHSEVLFTKLPDEDIAALRDRYSGTQAEREQKAETPEAPVRPASPGPVQPGPGRTPEEIAAAFTATLDLRVAKIVKVERHPNAEKLYIETLDIAGEERLIVSGLVPFYTEEELLGKHIVVAYNLRAAKLRGVMSRGMLLAAGDRDPQGIERCEVLDAAGIPTGTRVVLEGAAGVPPEVPPEISIDTFFSIPLAAKDGRVCAGGKVLMLEGKPITTSVVRDGEVH
ncbi:MAG: methionine--tRNA ligase [Spirochaetaceae bacterium]|jgi:methionyl-tRNA synthetase|nr:methionine--tRNA ligase [Spirochaetaceae bacterium]